MCFPKAWCVGSVCRHTESRSTHPHTESQTPSILTACCHTIRAEKSFACRVAPCSQGKVYIPSSHCFPSWQVHSDQMFGAEAAFGALVGPLWVDVVVVTLCYHWFIVCEHSSLSEHQTDHYFVEWLHVNRIFYHSIACTQRTHKIKNADFSTM